MGMPVAHNSNNFTLGKGIGYFGKLNSSGVNVTGEMDLGNISALGWNVDIETLAHFSQRSGMKKKDKEITVQVTPKFTATLDEPTPENLSLMGMGDVERISQSASDNDTAPIVSLKNRYFSVPGRGIGITVVPFKGGTVAFNLDAVLSGATGSGTIVGIEVTSGTPGTSDEAGFLYIQDVTPGFILDEVLADDDATAGAGVCAAVEIFDITKVGVREDTTEYVAGTDFTVDSNSGRVFIPETSTITDSTALTVYYGKGTKEWTQIKCYENSSTEGVFRFVGDAPAGINKEFIALKTSVKPSGDVTLVGDDWETITLEFELLADVNGDYLQINMDDLA